MTEGRNRARSSSRTIGPSSIVSGTWWLGAEVSEKMREAGADRLPAQVVEVDDVLFTVVGVLERRAENHALPIQVNADNSVFVAITTSRRLVPDSGIEVIVARSRPDVPYEAAAEDVRSRFRERAPDAGPKIVTAKRPIARMEAQMGIFTLLLGAVGSNSPIVGGIGIMNIMPVSVAERRAEIAIRQAPGARRRDTRSRFLIESVILTVTGGLLGILRGRRRPGRHPEPRARPAEEPGPKPRPRRAANSELPISPFLLLRRPRHSPPAWSPRHDCLRALIIRRGSVSHLR